MALNQTFAGGMLAMLVAVSSPLTPLKTASASPQQLAQSAHTTITGQLDENSETLEDGSYINIHTFEGQAGEAISIELVSEAFDTYLILLGPDEQPLAEDDDGNGGTNSRIVVTLPTTGTYQMVASSYAAGETGPYTLTWQPATTADVAQVEALQRATELNQQADELYQAGRYQEAIPLAEEVLAIRREQLGERHPDVAASLNNLAVLYHLQGRYGEAETRFLEALDISREQLGERHPAVASNLNNLAELYRAQGRYGEAETRFLEALDILQEQLGERHPDVATSLNNLAVLYHAQGRYGEAETCYLQALDIRQEQLGERHPLVATSLNNLAGLYQAQGRYGEAEPRYLQALDILQEQLGNRHPDVAQSLNNLAELYQAQGRYGEAEPHYLEALDIRQEQLGDRHPDVATSLNNLANLYRLQGRYGEAEPRYLEALGIYREQLGNRHPDVATSLNNLAGLYRDQGRYGEAEPRYLEALDIRQEQLGNRHPDVATSLNGLAGLYRDQGRYGEAEPYYLEALDIRQEQLGDRHPDVAASLNNLAVLYHLQGRYGEAETRYLQALDILQEQLGNRHPDVAASLNNLAALYLAQENPTRAIQAFQEGLAIEESNLEVTLAPLTEAQRQDYAATLSGTTDRAISLSLQAAEAQPLGLTTLLRRKGRLLEAGSSSLQRLRQNLTPEDQVVLNDLVSVQQQLATLTFNPPANLPPEDYRDQLAELESQAAELEKTLAQRSAVFRAESAPVEVAAVQAQIPANGVLVEYARYQPVDVKAELADRLGDPRYAAYLLFPDGRIEVIDLGDAATIDNAVEDFITLLQDPRADLRATIVQEIRPEVVEEVTGTLKTLILDPIAPYIQDRQHLLISPDSQLNRLPFEALITDSGEYLVEQYQISYLSSGRDLLKFDVVEPSSEPAVIVANPDYESASAPSSVAGERANQASETSASRSSTDMGRLTVTPLPGTAEEVAAIAPLLPGATILTEASATENALKQAQKPSILHIATHGFFLADAPRPEPADNRGLIASTDGSRAFASVSAPIENPLLRSGLALAGFNTRTSGDEDGVFTALEAANLNLYGTQLVVLSACDTGLGDINNGEGVYGLRRAFAIAGAETQLLSLWQVSDYGTQSLMARYYENLMDGMGRSEALRAVQLEMIRDDGEYAHPYYWAAFILAGDWRPLDAPSK
jgi:tetratricopeptide (TPR) repeat protein